VEVEGFLPNSVLRLAGYKIKADGPPQEEKEKSSIELSLVGFLHKTFPECKITVSPPTALRSA
jgi:hypothetical protein